ncbi:MAG: PAS domain S-box protein, partial [candidate division Zixibacteria bacterium]|nr:PAS domain S-box protein [candidate division Zixibacteria bacterium]
MKLITIKKRELLDLCIVLIVAAILSIFSISIHTIGKLFNFFSAYTDLPLAEFLINISFLSLTGLLWITYVRWRKTAKRQAELENIISSISPDVLLVVDSDRTIIECNNSLKRMFGYEVNEVINHKTDFLYFDLRSNQSNQDGWHETYDMLERDDFHIGWATGKKKNDATIPLEIIVGNLSGRGGAVLLLRDITERKRAEEVLRESERRFRRFAFAVTDVIYRYDPRNNQYDFISPSFELQTGYSLEEIKSDPSGVTRRITHPDDAERVFKKVYDHIKKGPGAGPFCTEYRVIRKDGEVIWVSDRKDIEFTSDGKVRRINGVVRDITERKRMEE